MADRGFKCNPVRFLLSAGQFPAKRKIAASDAQTAPKAAVFTLSLTILKSGLYQITRLNIDFACHALLN